ncbi:MAG: YlcI/YnfO family protein, partial [Thiothrix sp.]
MKQNTAYPLRLPPSLKEEVNKAAALDNISINQFIAQAVAEKLAALRTARFFAERRERADFVEFRRILTRQGG